MDRRRAAGALLALAACIACSAAAPTASNHTALDLYEGAKEGCYYNFQHYGEGDRIMTNEPCLNCTCHNRMLMCYLRVCPFTKPIGQDCTVEKRADQCCPIVTCPDVPVDLLTSTSTTSPAEYGATGLGKPDKYGCSINGRYLPEGSKVPPTPNKPCEHCYCIRNMTTCVMQECTLHVDGCTPIYHKDVCCPVRYSCDHPEDEVPLLDDMSTTVRPTPGFLLTTTTLSPVTQMSQDCVHNDQIISDGASITTEKACEHCYCMKGDIVCVVQECGAPMENEGKNCTSLPPREGQCCPDTYICEGDEPNADVSTESLIDALAEKLTTISPPRRTGVEGSGYRNEDDVAHTQMPTLESELEGSGEEQDTLQGTQEPVIPGKPLEPEEISHSFEEGDQYIPVTPKPSAPISQVPETSSENIENETIEPQLSVITTQQTEEDFEKATEATKIDKDKPYEHETAVSPGISESLESGTMQPSDFLNTVPDILAEQEHGKPHEYTPTTVSTSVKESDDNVQKETEYSMGTSSYNEQDITLEPVSQGPLVSEYTTVSLDTSADIESATTKKTYDIPESVTVRETSQPEVHVDAMTIVSDLEEIRTSAPQAVDTTPENALPEDNAISIEYASTTNIPTVEKVEKITTELDQAQNTVGVIEEGTIYTPIPNVDLAEKTTPSEVQVDVTSPASITKEPEKTTVEPDRGQNTIPSEIKEETTQSSLLETRNTEPTIAVDSTEHLEKDTKLSTTSEFSTSLPETHITKGDQYTITTEPSFRREDEASVSTEKPKQGLERTTVKTDLVDEGLIPTSIHDKESETGTNIPYVDEYITTGIPDYIDSDKELDDAVVSVKPVTESDSATAIVSDTVTEKVTDIASIQDSGLPTSTEKTMEVTVLNAEDDNQYEPSRIPGEGDCLLNAVSYRNNTVVPSTNKCHVSCKCVSSIIKCDPVICSPLPVNMHNCQSIYDNPDSCCPTYICDSKETVPPKSDSQMSGTEPPVRPPIIECRGDQCELSVTKEPPKYIEPCTSDSCVLGVDQEFKPQDGQQIPCNEENGCKSQGIIPSDCTGDEPCRRKDTDIDQALPPKCEGSHCVQEIGNKATETATSDKIPIEVTPVKHVPTEQEPSQSVADSQETKENDVMTTPIAQITTENVYGSTEHSLFATTEGEIMSDKITEKIDVDIATEEFIPAKTEGTKKPDQFEQGGIDKPTKDEAVSHSVGIKEKDIKKPVAEKVEGETHEPEIAVDTLADIDKITSTAATITYVPDTAEQGYTDEPIITNTQETGKPYEQPEKPILVKEEDTKIPHGVADEYTMKPGLTGPEDTIIPIVTEGHKIPDIAIKEQADKSTTTEEMKVSDTTDKGYDDKHINEIDTTQSILTEQEITTVPGDIGQKSTSKPEFIQNLDTKIPEAGTETTETPSYFEKDVTKAPDTEKDIKIPDSFVKDKTDRPTSFEDNFTKVPVITDDKYTESISTDDDRSTIMPDSIDKTNTDIPAAIEEQTIDTNIPDEQSYKPDDLLVQNEGTKVPDLVKEDTHKIIPNEEASTKLPGIDVDNYTDKIDVTDQEGTMLPHEIGQKHTEIPFMTEEITSEISESVTDKGVISGDEVRDKPISVDAVRPDEPSVVKVEAVENTESNKEEGITQSVISEDSTGLPEMVEKIVTIKPLLIDETTESPVEMEDTKVTKMTDIMAEGTTDNGILIDNKMTDKPSVIEEGTKRPDVLQKEDNELIDKDSAQETQTPEIQASTQASITTEHELPSEITVADGSSVKEEKRTDGPAYVTPAIATEESETELYVAPINEQLPELDIEAIGKDKISTQDISKPTPGSVISQTSSISPVSEQEIKPAEPEIFTPEKEEMITSSIDSTVTEPFKGFTEIDDAFATETATRHHEEATVEPFITEKQISEKEKVSGSTELPISDGKIITTPEGSYTESYQKPETSTTLPVSTEPPRETDPMDSENKITDSNQSTFTDLPISEITLVEEKPYVPLDSTDSQNEKATKMPDFFTHSDLGTPTSPSEMYVTGVQSPTAKPESHVTELTEEQPKVEHHEQPQKPKLPETPTQPEITDAPESVPLEVYTKYPHVQVITEVSPSLVADPDISGKGETTTGKDDTKQIGHEIYTTSPEKITERPHIDLEITKPIEEINTFTEQTSVNAGISETTPYLIELEEHTHKMAEDIPAISTSEKEQHTNQATEISTSPRYEDNIFSGEDSSTISPEIENHEGDKTPGFGSDSEVTAEKETFTTEEALHPDIHVETDTATENDIIVSSTTEVPKKEGDSGEKYGEPSVKPTSETESFKPTLSEDKDSKPDEELSSETGETILPVSQDKDRKPDEEPVSEIIPSTTIDKDSKPDIETADIIPIVSKDKDSQSEKEAATEETLPTSTPEDKDKKPDEKPVSGTEEIIPPVTEDKDSHPGEELISGIEGTVPPVTAEKDSQPKEKPISDFTTITNEETTIPSTSTSTYDKPDEQHSTEVGDIITPLSKDKDDKPDVTSIGENEAPMPSSSEDKDNKLDGKPGLSETDKTSPSVSQDKYGKPDEQLSGETGDILYPHSEEKDDKDKPVTEDKYVKPDDTFSSEPQPTIPPGYLDKDSKPDKKPIGEIESITPPSSEQQYGMSHDRPGSETDDIISPSKDKDDKPDERPIIDAGETETSISDDKYDKPDVTASSETEVTSTPITVDIVSKPDEQPVDDSEKITPSISEDKYDMADDKFTTETSDILTSLSKDKDGISDKKPTSEPEEIMPPSSDEKYGKPDVLPSSETETSIPPLSVDMYGKPDGEPISDSKDTILSVSTDKYDKVDEKPTIGLDKTPPLVEDKESKPDETPISGIDEIIPTMPGDIDSKLEKKPTSGTEDIISPMSEDKVSQSEEKPSSGIESNVTPTSEYKDTESTEKPVDGTVDIVLPISEEKDNKPEEKPISGIKDTVSTVSEDKQPEQQIISGTGEFTTPIAEDKDNQPEQETTSETGDIIPPVSEEKTQTEQESTSSSGDTVPSSAEDKEPEEKPTGEPGESVPSGSQEKDSKPGEKPTSGIEELVPSVSEDQENKAEEKPISGIEETVPPVAKDKDSKPDEEPISETGETMPTIPEDKDEKPITGSGDSMPPVFGDGDSKFDKEPIGGIGEIEPPVTKDKDSKPEETPISTVEETVQPGTGDKDSKPDERPISDIEGTVRPGSEDKETRPDEKPISGIEETLPPVTKDKDSIPEEELISETGETIPPASGDKDGKPDEKPISESGDSMPPVFEDEDSKFDKKPISGLGETVPPVTEDKYSKPDEKPISGTEETVRPVTGDKDSKPEETPISGTEETIPPVTEDKDSHPGEEFISGIEGTVPTIIGEKDTQPEEKPISGIEETIPPVSEDKDSHPEEEIISGIEGTVPPVTGEKDSQPEAKPISGIDETITPVTEDKDGHPEEESISGIEGTAPPVTGEKDGQPKDKPISGIEEIVQPVSEDKVIKPDETPVSEDKDSKPDEKPSSGTGETEPAISEDTNTKPDKKPISGAEEIVPPVTEDKYIKPGGETGATISPMSQDKFSKPDEILASQTTESMPPAAADNYGKPDVQPSEETIFKPSSATSEIPKPLAEAHPTDELPVPEEEGHFPPSGTGYGEPDYVEEDQAFGPGTCRYGGKVYVSAQQIPRDDPCDFCFCFRSDIICLQQSCPPPIHGCHEEPIQGFCCPRYECPVSMATTVNVTTTTTTTTTTLPPHFPTHSYKGAAQRRGCQIKGHTYKVGDVVRSSSGPCLHCTCGGDGQMKCDPKACTPEPMLRQMIAAAVSAKRRR